MKLWSTGIVMYHTPAQTQKFSLDSHVLHCSDKLFKDKLLGETFFHILQPFWNERQRILQVYKLVNSFMQYASVIISNCNDHSFSAEAWKELDTDL